MVLSRVALQDAPIRRFAWFQSSSTDFETFGACYEAYPADAVRDIVHAPQMVASRNAPRTSVQKKAEMTEEDRRQRRLLTTFPFCNDAAQEMALAMRVTEFLPSADDFPHYTTGTFARVLNPAVPRDRAKIEYATQFLAATLEPCHLVEVLEVFNHTRLTAFRCRQQERAAQMRQRAEHIRTIRTRLAAYLNDDLNHLLELFEGHVTPAHATAHGNTVGVWHGTSKHETESVLGRGGPSVHASSAHNMYGTAVYGSTSAQYCHEKHFVHKQRDGVVGMHSTFQLVLMAGVAGSIWDAKQYNADPQQIRSVLWGCLHKAIHTKVDPRAHASNKMDVYERLRSMGFAPKNMRAIVHAWEELVDFHSVTGHPLYPQRIQHSESIKAWVQYNRQRQRVIRATKQGVGSVDFVFKPPTRPPPVRSPEAGVEFSHAQRNFAFLSDVDVYPTMVVTYRVV